MRTSGINSLLNDGTLRIKSYIKNKAAKEFNFHRAYVKNGIVTNEKLIMHKANSTISYSYDNNGNIKEQTIKTPNMQTIISYSNSGKIKSVMNMDDENLFGAKRYREYSTKTGKVVKDTAKDSSILELINGTTQRIEIFIQKMRERFPKNIFFPIDDVREKKSLLIYNDGKTKIVNHYNQSGNIIEHYIETSSNETKIKYNRFGRLLEVLNINPITKEILRKRKYDSITGKVILDDKRFKN